MASCSFGASSLKLSSLNLGCVTHKSNASRWQLLNCIRTPKSIKCEGFGLVAIHKAHKTLIGCQCSVSDIDSAAISEASTEDKYSGVVSKLIPNPLEVEYLLTTICDTTSIAEFELKLGGFRLHVTRDLSGQTMPSSPPTSAPVSVSMAEETSGSNGSLSSHSLAIIKPESSSYGVRTLLERAADDGLKILPSPRVGFFRRSRTIKGKRAPPSCKEKQLVKEGQVLCYIEQLGGEIPVESDVSGEVIKIFSRDGDPVGYGDPLIAILPSFPGIKKLQ
ncbi:hypothetical protein Leryth_024918 [Lithospermum erythrorhizon]|nr:hypothetical protein Leryth_024918 [Lithospermum erythrorhizon]